MKKIGILVSVILLILCTAGCVHTDNSKKQETSNFTRNIDKYWQEHDTMDYNNVFDMFPQTRIFLYAIIIV